MPRAATSSRSASARSCRPKSSACLLRSGLVLPLVKQVGAILAALLAFLFIGKPLIRAAKARAAERAERNARWRKALVATDGRPALASRQ